MPPATTRYSNPDIFIELEDDLVRLNTNPSYIVIAGDFNAHIGSHVEHQSHVHNLDVNKYLDVDDDNDEMQCQEPRFQSRSSVDTKFNDYGKKLLDVCSNNDLYVMNGRVGSDRNIGKATFKDSKSVIDYVIVSPEILCDNTEFNVLDFDYLFSDIHCVIKTQISLCINCSGNDENTPIKTHIEGVGCLASHPKPMSLFNLSICHTLTVLYNPYKKGKSM